MTKNQVQAWATSSVKADNATVTRVVVPNVRINAECTQKVRFLLRKDKHVIVARTKGFDPIRIRADGDKFRATAQDGFTSLTAPTAAKAFANAAKVVWVN